MSEFYDATFRWPHPDASNVIVTGSFDSWSGSHHLAKTSTGLFEGVVKLPWGEKFSYKYIVDGRWTTTDDQPTEMDPMGNLNNVFRSPARPEPEPTSTPEPAPEPETAPEQTETTTVGALSSFVATAKQAAVSMVEALAPGTAETPAPTPAVETPAEVSQTPADEEPTPAATAETPVPQPAAEVTNAAVLPSAPVNVLPLVPIAILPLGTEQPTDATTAPLADVSEAKPLDTTIVEDTTTTSPAPEVHAEQPSTHTPVIVNGKGTPVEEKPVTNGVNGAAHDAPELPKPSTNGTTQEKAAAPAVPASPSNGKLTTPTKEKKMRFPSLSSRHSRKRSSVESGGTGAGELGEKESPKGKGEDAAAVVNGKDTVSSRFTNTQRQQRRSSLFGKLRDVFTSPKKEAPA